LGLTISSINLILRGDGASGTDDLGTSPEADPSTVSESGPVASPGNTWEAGVKAGGAHGTCIEVDDIAWHPGESPEDAWAAGAVSGGALGTGPEYIEAL
jgi:hypothetical protein